ncbi:MAG: FkbM family methyltransferase [Paracoccaceae bacterium]
MTPNERLKRARKDLKQAHDDLIEGLKKNHSRQRAPFVRMLHEVRGMLNQSYPYFSQAGQDQIVDRAMGGKHGGTFVDIGGYDGVSGSNSLYFEKWRGWTGILVEPVETHRKKAETLRACPCLPYAVSDTRGKADFITVTQGYTQMSGLADTYPSDLLKRVRADKRHAEEEISVETRTIADILDEAQISDPDFISLDIEGGELAALKVFPFAKHRVGAWSIENNAATPEVAELMKANGYKLVEFCGPDEIYVSEEVLSKAK